MMTSHTVNNADTPVPRSQAGARHNSIPADSHSSLRTSPGSATTDKGQELITYIFPDFEAVEYFSTQFKSTNEFHVVERTEATGFEIYLVDQWIRDRRIGSIISVFTGNAQSRVQVTKFTTIKKSSREYPSRFQEYLNELILNHATFKRMDSSLDETPSDEHASSRLEVPEYLLITNISKFPHNLNLIPIAEGDTRAVKPRYMVNSNLKKFNCGGRSLSLMATKITDVSEDKFRQMYRILNNSVPIRFAILELVNLVQICLFYFDLLEAKYADGLLCQKTEDAIQNWWNLIGLPHFNTKPDTRFGVFSSKTVAAIISLTVSVKMRLQLFGGCDVPKDPFDAENFMLSIGQFQKQARIEKKRKLNLLTLSKLFFYTNQTTSTDKSRYPHYPFGNDISLDDLEGNQINDKPFLPSSSPVKNTTSNSLPTSAASAYRRNKLYYSKELKKLTNVVKNTVQDHIIVKEDPEETYADPQSLKTSGRFNRIVSKITEINNPTDVETTDIEILFKKCIVGPTLSRLWIGLSLGGSQSKISDGPQKGQAPNVLNADFSSDFHSSRQKMRHQHHQHHHLIHNHSQDQNHYIRDRHHEKDAENGRMGPDSSSLGEDFRYKFVCFRDSFREQQELNSTSDRSGRLGRMKFVFQSRKNPSKLELEDKRYAEKNKTISSEEYSDNLVDAELSKILKTSSPASDDHEKNCHQNIADTSKCLNFLVRRNSTPCMSSTKEVGFVSFDLLGTGICSTSHVLKRSLSSSLIEDYFESSFELQTYERTRADYLSRVLDMMRLENLKKDANHYYSETVSPQIKQMNSELAKIENLYSQMKSKRSYPESDYAALLKFRMRDLTDNLDKMAFRSRNLMKKIDELDVNLEAFQAKLQIECNGKLDGVISKLLQSKKFQHVFGNLEERRTIIKALTGEEYVELDTGETSKNGFLQQIIVFFYEIMLVVLQVFNFDRSRMNLDRIRDQYSKLDPERKYIGKIYNLVGEDSIEDKGENEPSSKS